MQFNDFPLLKQRQFSESMRQPWTVLVVSEIDASEAMKVRWKCALQVLFLM